MVVWSGWGLIALAIWVAALAVAQLVVDRVYEPDFYTAHVWPKIAASGASAIIIWFVGRAMNGSANDRQRIHGARHTLFWIPVEYWGPIFLSVGVAIALVHNYNNS